MVDEPGYLTVAEGFEPMNQKKINDHRLLTGITLRDLLSFGRDTPPLELQNLNVLIGPNAVGKSNLIEAISLMRASPVPAGSSSLDLRGVVRRGGGAQEWIWKGANVHHSTIGLSFNYSKLGLNHQIQFEADPGFSLRSEIITGRPLDKLGIFFMSLEGVKGLEQFDGWFPGIHEQVESLNKNGLRGGVPASLQGKLAVGESVLSQLRDPDQYPEITYLAESYEKIRIYRDWTFGRNTVFRQPQQADMRNDRLEEDFSNLGLFLSRLSKTPKARAAILERLQDLYDGVTDFQIFVEGGTVQVFFTEGEFTVPASRLSDGTLRYLCLLAILCDPSPPPLICIEEPELGLHPDIMPKLADLLVEASERTQLIVTTHSDILIDAMSHRPESVIVCEKHDGKTEMNRLKREELKDWLAKYSLGELWTRGEIGGTRW